MSLGLKRGTVQLEPHDKQWDEAAIQTIRKLKSILGVNEPVGKFTGKIIAIVHRKDDVEEKWVVVPDGMMVSKDEIRQQIYFQEQYFDSEIVM